MIKSMILNKGIRKIFGLTIVTFMLVALFGSIEESKTVSDEGDIYYSIGGNVTYRNDSQWSDIIRQVAFDENAISVDLYNGNTFLQNMELQSYSVDDECHLSFVHDGEGGGNYVISNIPSMLDSVKVTKVVICIDGIPHYADLESEDIEFDESNITASNVDLYMEPNLMPINIREQVIGEDESIAVEFSVKVTAKNTNSDIEVTSTSKSNTYTVSKDTPSNKKGTTIYVPVGLSYKIAQVERSDYSVTGNDLSYTGLNTSGAEKTVALQTDVLALSEFVLEPKRSNINITKYNVVIKNAAKNVKNEWKLQWLDNHSVNRPEATFKLYYSVEGSDYAEVTEDVLEELGMETMPTYSIISNITSEDILTYRYTNLSSITTEGKFISYNVKQTTVSDDYIMTYDSQKNMFTNTIKVNFTATIKWLETDVDAKVVRPGENQIKNYLKLYRYIHTEYEEIELTNSEIVIEQTGGNKNKWKITIDKELPQYSEDTDRYTYVLVEGSIDSTGTVYDAVKKIKKNGYTGEEEYEVVYYNEGSTEVKQDRCFKEQLILHVLDSDVEYGATKIWKDAEDATRPVTRVTLWRYPMVDARDTEIDISRSARVIAYDEDGNDLILSYELKTGGKKVSSINAENKYEEKISFNTHTVEGLDKDYKLPKYDETGNEYKYFIVETVENSTLATYYESTYRDKKGNVVEIGIDNTGTITSVRAGRVALEINKVWNAASAASDLDITNVTFKVLAREEGQTSYKNLEIYEGVAGITDFGTTKLKDSTEILINPYDSNGIKYDDIVVQEASITTNGSKIGISYSSEDRSTWEFKIGSNTYEGVCGALVKKGQSVFYNTDLYTVNVINTITTERDYPIRITWSEDITEEERCVQTVYITGTSIKYKGEENPEPTVKYSVQVNNDATYMEDGVTLRGTAIFTNEDTGETFALGYTQVYGEDGVTEWLVDELPGLRRYDSEGYLLEYNVSGVYNHLEDTIVEWSTAFNVTAEGAWIQNIKTDDDNYYVLTAKTWRDGGDTASRYTMEISLTDPTDPNDPEHVFTIDGSTYWSGVEIFSKYKFGENGISPGTLVIKETLIGPDGTRYESYEKDMDNDGVKETYITTDLFTYRVEITEEDKSIFREDSLGGINETNILGIDIKNTRVDTVDIVIESIWKDGENENGIRPGEIEFIVDQFDIKGNKVDSFKITLDEDDNYAVFGNDAWKKTKENLPKYDEYGNPYSYYITETPVYKSNTATDEYKAYLEYEFTPGVSVPNKNYEYGDPKVDDVIKYICTNQLEATTSITVYQKWYDQAMSDEGRPDFYLTIYRKDPQAGSGAGTGDIPVTSSYKNQIWTSGGEGAYYTWAIEFLYLEKYDSNGYELEYYVVEDINDASDMGMKYRIEYREAALSGPIIQEQRASNGDYIVNILQDTVVIEGEKIWKNIAGFGPDDLPDVEIELYRKHPEDTSDGLGDRMGSVVLTNGQTLFGFTHDENNEELQKYTEFGAAYTYNIKEVAEPILKPGECTEGDLYTITRINNTIINVFNTDTNIRDIVITKTWNRDEVYDAVEEDVYPSVTLKLYRTTQNVTSTSNMTFIDSITVSGDTFKAVNGAPYDITFEDVYIYSPKGERYKYYVEETAIDAYKTEYSVEENVAGIEATNKGIYFRDVIRINDENKVSKGTVHNTFVPTYDLSAVGFKEWDDYKNYYGLRPESINITLSRNTTTASGRGNVSTIKLPLKTEDAQDLDTTKDIYVSWNKNATSTGNDTWMFTIHNLPKYAANGHTYNYTVREDDAEVEKYYTCKPNSISKNARDESGGVIRFSSRIINSFSSTCTVKKHWIDGNNEYNFRPKSVTMKLQMSSDGGVTWEDMMIQEVGSTTPITQVITNATKYVIPYTKNNSWTYKFSNLPSRLIVEDKESRAIVENAIILAQADKEAKEKLDKAAKLLEDARLDLEAARATLDPIVVLKESYEAAKNVTAAAQNTYDATLLEREAKQSVYDNYETIRNEAQQNYQDALDAFNSANDAYAEAERAFKDAEDAVELKKQAVESFRQTREAAETVRRNAQQFRDDARRVKDDLERTIREMTDKIRVAEESVEKAQTEYEKAVEEGNSDRIVEAQSKLTEAQEIVASMKASKADKENALIEAQANLDEAEEAFVKAEEDVKQIDDLIRGAEEEKRDAEGVVEEKKRARDQARRVVDDAERAKGELQVTLSSAIDNLLIAERELNDAKSGVAEALEALEQAQESERQAREAFENSNPTYEEALEAYNIAAEAVVAAEEAYRIVEAEAEAIGQEAEAAKTEALKYVDEIPASADDIPPIYVDREIIYKCVETHIGNTEIPEGSNQVGSYIMSEVSTDNNVTQIKNSMQSTKLNVTKVWDDVDNYYQTRFNTTYYRLERIEQTKLNSDGTLPEDGWEQVTDIDGKPTVFSIDSSRVTKDSNGKYNLWKKTFYNLPIAREGDTSIGEPKIVRLYYRVVECTSENKNPQLVSVVKGSDGTYTIQPTKTYQNYVDVTDYASTWSYTSSANTNYTTVTNHMITKEDENEDKEDKLVSTIEAKKEWRKDPTYSNYDVTIELKRSINGGNYVSFPTSITQVIKKNGPSVSWDNMPAFDENGKTIDYKAIELTTDAWFRCETYTDTTEEEKGKRVLYTFVNIQQTDYKIYVYWENNSRTLPTSEYRFTSNVSLEKRITSSGEWEPVLNTLNNPIKYSFATSTRTQYSNSTSTGKMDLYTVDNERIYYRGIQTHINGQKAEDNKAYVSENVDAELNGDVYTDNGATYIYNTVRTESLNLTKIWDDDNDCDSMRPTLNSSKLKMTLEADYGSGYVTVPTSFYTLKWKQDPDDGNKWTATISNLPKYNKTGTVLIKYRIKETTIPSRYFVSKDAEVPTFTDEINSYDYSITNTLTLLIKLKKYDGVNNKALAGTQFKVYKGQYVDGDLVYNQQVGTTLTADANGYISFEIAQVGDFKLIETKAVKGYELLLDEAGEPDLVNGNPFQCLFSVSDNNLRQTITITEANCYEYVEASSVSTTNNSGDFNVATAQPNNEKQGVYFSVIEGWYELVTDKGLINKRKLGELKSIKRDKNTSKELGGIVFELYKYENENGTGNPIYLRDIEAGKGYICSTTGDLVITETGDGATEGTMTISKLPWGKYLIKEISTLTGYMLPNSTWTFMVNADTVNTTTNINENIVVKYNGSSTSQNNLLNEKTRFQFIKRGYNNVKLTGGKFKIVSNDANRTEQKFWKNTYTDDESKKVTELLPNDIVYGLPVGSYRIVEVEVPYGYKPADDVVFSINNYGWIINSSGVNTYDRIVTMYDEPVTADLINVDEDFITPINGSTFEITGQFANSTGSAISDVQTISYTISNYKWAFRGNLLPSERNGKKYIYKMQQTNAATKFELNSTIFYFIINENYEVELTDKDGNKPDNKLRKIYEEFLKTDNEATVPAIIFENLRIPVNDIYIENGEAYIDRETSEAVKLFYAYDTKEGNTKLGEPIKFYVDKSNIGLLEFAVTTSRDGKNPSHYIHKKHITIYDSKGNKVEASTGHMYKLKEMEKYTLHISSDYLEGIGTGSRMLYLYSHMPRIDDIEGVYVVRRTAFEEH